MPTQTITTTVRRRLQRLLHRSHSRQCQRRRPPPRRDDNDDNDLNMTTTTVPRSKRATAPMPTPTTTARRLELPFHHSASANDLEMTTMMATPPFHSEHAAAPTPMATTARRQGWTSPLPSPPTRAALRRQRPLRYTSSSIVLCSSCVHNLIYSYVRARTKADPSLCGYTD